MSEEIWKDIEGYEGLYQVSNWGRVRNAKTLDIKKEHIEKSTGYARMCVYKPGDKSLKKIYVHRTVAKAFIKNPDNYTQVGHKDETKTNNHADNLYWTTNLENNNTEKHCQRISQGRTGIRYKAKNGGKKVFCDNTVFDNLKTMCATYNKNMPTVWRWLNNVTAMPQEWIDKGLRYLD